jgi:hypothetical protein
VIRHLAAQRYPQLTLEIKRVLAESDMVVTHSQHRTPFRHSARKPSRPRRVGRKSIRDSDTLVDVTIVRRRPTVPDGVRFPTEQSSGCQ